MGHNGNKETIGVTALANTCRATLPTHSTVLSLTGCVLVTCVLTYTEQVPRAVEVMFHCCSSLWLSRQTKGITLHHLPPLPSHGLSGRGAGAAVEVKLRFYTGFSLHRSVQFWSTLHPAFQDTATPAVSAWW